MSKWSNYTLGEIAEITSSRRIFYSEYVSEGVPFYRSKEIIENYNHQDITTELYITRERFEQIKQKHGALKAGDILLTSVGTLGVPYLVKDFDEFYFKDGNLTWFRNINSKIIDRRYLYFWFISSIGQKKLIDASIGSTQPALTIVELKNIDLQLPSLEEQSHIVALLSSLDDKIDLLHRQNKTLESLASALWRKMFAVEADPNWKTGKLGDYGDFKNGINYSRSEQGDTEYSILNVRDIVESKYLTGNAFEKINVNASKAAPYLLQTNDIVIVRSASPGESLIVLGEIDNLLYSGFSIRLRCHNRQQALFVFQFLQSYRKEMDIFSDGTTLKNINQEILNNIDLVVPKDSAISEFNDVVSYIYNKIMVNQRQVGRLMHFRDAALPKLMSGEVCAGL